MKEFKGVQTIDTVLKCPICGNPVNRYQAIGFIKGKVLVLVECWSGSLDKNAPKHLFVIKLKLHERTRSIITTEVTEEAKQ